MKKQIIKKLEAIADEFGADELEVALQSLGGFNNEGDGDTGENPCPPGHRWSSSLKRCVADPG